MGLCHKLGAGTKVDLAEAVKWYKRAAEQGQPIAQVSLVLSIFPKTKHRVTRTVSVCSQCNLGNALATGQGVATDVKEAKRYFKLAAKQGNAQAKAALAHLEQPVLQHTIPAEVD